MDHKQKPFCLINHTKPQQLVHDLSPELNVWWRNRICYVQKKKRGLDNWSKAAGLLEKPLSLQYNQT